MTETKFWGNQIVPPEYFREVNPYEDHRVGRETLPGIDHLKLSKYIKESGKKPVEMTFDEIRQFVVNTTEESCEM